ncbi:hypothetical protein O3G_MSEX008765 [Manduca sexta]|uniref:Uncharacterized protein n=3 Tax=Manduca sexta TaxID=7130 RepID=A0A921ZAS0_MANSE|nr:hypothetical protein O3G_MSEX008765 [Manduca sexta]KAG6454574.1 hypothetical protein O3G_MSEX008765 [Manduca sexta]
MESMEDRINKLREERIAREKARIEKLRELNLKKYNKIEPQLKNAPSNTTINKPIKNDKFDQHKKASSVVKNNFHVNGTTKKPITMPIVKKTSSAIDAKPKNKFDTNPKIDKSMTEKPKSEGNKIANATSSKTALNDRKEVKSAKFEPKLARKSLAVPKRAVSQPTTVSRKSMLPKPLQTSSETVFDRLYKPKMVTKEHLDSVKKLQTDPNYLQRVIKNSGLILNKRHTLFETKQKPNVPVRRSISAVHFKRISKNEIQNCIHKWSSIGDKMNNVHLKDINEDENIKEDKVVSAVKSERKRVTFMTPVPQNFNTPRPEELQARLKNWLYKRGKSLDSYHHLQCFGINHLVPRDLKLDFEAIKYDDDENKENIALESDSDDDSVSEMHGKESVVGMWRRASNISESVDLNETTDTMVTTEEPDNVDDVVVGALNDLTELLKEGFEWEQCARWLRAIRERFPAASNTAAYWECRAALEETRGDLPASVQCWEEAIAKGTEHSVVEANLDQLLDKFMQLKISPNSGKRRQADPKMVDVKNVFKSTIIRFAVQQAKL